MCNPFLLETSLIYVSLEFIIHTFNANFILVTSNEPVLLETNADHCYIRTGEFSNNVNATDFQTGVVTFDDYYESIHNVSTPQIKVNPYTNHLVTFDQSSTRNY